MLSLPAPRNCVQKNGAKRRSRRRSYWLGECIVWRLQDGFAKKERVSDTPDARRAPPEASLRKEAGAGTGALGIGSHGRMTRPSRLLFVEVFQHRSKRRAHGIGIGPVPDFLAGLLACQNPGLAQHLEVMRDRRA